MNKLLSRGETPVSHSDTCKSVRKFKRIKNNNEYEYISLASYICVKIKGDGFSINYNDQFYQVNI